VLCGYEIPKEVSRSTLFVRELLIRRPISPLSSRSYNAILVFGQIQTPSFLNDGLVSIRALRRIGKRFFLFQLGRGIVLGNSEFENFP
jgi:hypothetical protein